MSENKPDLMAELAACPFCGGEAELFEGYGAFVVCAECEVEGPYKAFKDDAIAAWNKRTHHAELEAVVRKACQLSDAQCDAIYEALDTYASDVDHYEFGLPWHSDEGPEKRREVIRQAMHNSAREG